MGMVCLHVRPEAHTVGHCPSIGPAQDSSLDNPWLGHDTQVPPFISKSHQVLPDVQSLCFLHVVPSRLFLLFLLFLLFCL